MQLHNQMKQIHSSLRAMSIQGKALLSCEDISPEQVDAYRELVDTVLEGGEMSLDDLSASAQTKAEDNHVAIPMGTETGPVVNEGLVEPSPLEEPVVSSESEKDDKEDDEAKDDKEEEEDDKKDDKETEEEVDDNKDIHEELADHHEEQVEAADKEVEAVIEASETTEEEEVESTPRDDLEETVDKVDHVAQKIETFITATEGSGLTTDDVQAMQGVKDNFESIDHLMRNVKLVANTKSARLIKAIGVLSRVVTRNVNKVY